MLTQPVHVEDIVDDLESAPNEEQALHALDAPGAEVRWHRATNTVVVTMDAALFRRLVGSRRSDLRHHS